MEEELEFHLEERVRENVARGMDPEAAREAALERLGKLDEVREECAELLRSERRTSARRDWMKVSWLDFKLGFRMLVKYPGLTIVGGLAMAFAIWVGAGTFEFARQVIYPNLPLDEGHRVVGIQVRDAERGGIERQVGREFLGWRGELETIRELGAFRTLGRNLITGDGRGEPVEVAEMSPSGFDVARVPPLLGRTLVAADEEPGAPLVVVLGHDVWQGRFGGDPEIVGRSLRLGRSRATVVGVMPEDFAFPVAQSLWMPLRPSELDREPRSGPGLRLFGRLAPGASLADAQAELRVLGRRAAADLPETHEHLRPEVVPYPKSILSLPAPASLGLASMNFFVVLLLVLICSNVALLMFARAATREAEILVRSALGASRGRIVTQLFVEALVLGGLAAALGLAAAGFGLRWLFTTVVPEVSAGQLPFWFSDSISTATVVYSVLLTLMAAAVAGVTPALKVTGREVGSRLRETGAGGGGLRFGGVWTGVIVMQVALTVTFPATAYITHRDMSQIRDVELPFPEEQYLSVRLEMDRDVEPGSADTAAAQFAERFRNVTRELEQRLELHPAVAGVTFGERLPRMYHPHRLVELDEGGAAPLHPRWPGYRVSDAVVAADFFEVLGVPILSGRDFHSGDPGPDSRVILVNQPFVDRVLGGRNPIGRQVRYMYYEEEGDLRVPEEEPWYEIVGVVPDLGTSISGEQDPKIAAIYHPGQAGGVYPTHMAVHVRGGPESLTQELRSLAADVDPALRLYQPMGMHRLAESQLGFLSFWFWILILVSGVALILSLAGVYSVMSFAVSRRTREIGIRVALGGSRRRIMAAIFRGPLIQVGAGLLGGIALVSVLMRMVAGQLRGESAAWIGAYMLLMIAVCALACIVPTRRALEVEPTEALRAE